MQISAYQHGIYPRSETVVAATRDLERNRTSSEEVERRFREDEENFVGVQREAGLDYFSDGLLRWQDLFRPLVDHSPAMRAQKLVRWFDNNSFFRAPEIGDLHSAGGIVPSVFALNGELPEPRVATLPSPYVFSRAARGQAADTDRDALMLDLARNVLASVAGSLAGSGYRVVHLQEPWLPFFGMEEGAWEPFEDALRTLKDEIAGRATLVLHLYYGDVGPHAERLRRLPVDAVGFDFVETDLESLGRDWEIGVLAGCLDGRRSLVESVEGTVAFARRVAEALNPPALYLSSTSDLELLPLEVARRKVLRLGEAIRRLKDDLP
ncbi:MAG: hypothetical protein H0W27_00860 [Actinobacteria bacterium]|nr:hypothetical protein [Actinomycetota bacterium]